MRWEWRGLSLRVVCGLVLTLLMVSMVFVVFDVPVVVYVNEK